MDSSVWPIWEIEGTLPAETLSSLAAHPRFPDAARALASGMLTLAANDKAIDGIFKDAGRYVAALCAAALQGEGVTLPRLKALAARFGLLSSGRVRALLIYMRYLGYVEPWRNREKRGPAVYVVSARFLAAWRTHLRVALCAASLIEPAAAEIAERLDDPGFFTVFCAVQLDGLAAGDTSLAGMAAYARTFLQRNAGNQIGWVLITSAPPGQFPPEGSVAVRLSAVARAFRVSSMHVRRLFGDAAREGLIEPYGNGRVAFTEGGRIELRFFYATQLGSLLIACAETMRRERAAPLLENEGMVTGKCSNSQDGRPDAQ